MKKLALRLMALMAGLCVTQATIAKQALTQHFGDKKTCYARQYSDAHLAKNPRQTVSYLYVGHYPNQFESSKYNPEDGNVYLEVKARFKDDNAEYINGGNCRPENGILDCQIDCDGGGFKLVHKSQNSILLYTRPVRGFVVQACGAGLIRQVTDQTDDKIFLLKRLPDSQCIVPN